MNAPALAQTNYQDLAERESPAGKSLVASLVGALQNVLDWEFPLQRTWYRDNEPDPVFTAWQMVTIGPIHENRNHGRALWD